MTGRILVELEDLKNAENKLNQVIHKLEQDEIYLKTVYGRLYGWKGEAAGEMRSRMSSFFSELSVWGERLEERRDELTRYIDKMRQLDESWR
ncbi:hypothetical protein V3851_22260 [Paenibacillus sp. M1]|uniref:WXG100 family type VII secretion target n=1 Tax=Paenibacillus haidiansis TaxID=1574488 RepID=A0ABU7W058_9BACL